jgi:hypothetical protein
MKNRKDSTSRRVDRRVEPAKSTSQTPRPGRKQAKPAPIKSELRERDVGYGKPPRAHQFKPGQSGNPRGRPKGTLNLATDLAAELGEQITVREGDHTQRISKQRALVKSLMGKALDGDVRATTALLALYARIISEPPEDEGRPIDDDELLIIRRFGPRLVKSLARKRRPT